MESFLSTANSSSAEAVWSVLIAGAGLIAAISVLTLVIVKARKSLLKSSTEPGQAGFTLGELRAMHRRGELSDEEYNRARDVLIQQVRGSDHAGQDGEAAGD